MSDLICSACFLSCSRFYYVQHYVPGSLIHVGSQVCKRCYLIQAFRWSYYENPPRFDDIDLAMEWITVTHQKYETFLQDIDTIFAFDAYPDFLNHPDCFPIRAISHCRFYDNFVIQINNLRIIYIDGIVTLSN